ncbi:tetratricopeptide repeat protein [Nostocoides sp. F2B08]|uniref:ATP-binding protein n=1 Tax=Nostocoides sp. F2B08 TaxID=2653936 RepID=UPI0012633673|nr:tetratricopeptide repeat protein [Tetrasphaera sp. F2B08]KAB7741948.1 tetratricopeptide repeat protein [Tetrasphaera sp. F2B08]
MRVVGAAASAVGEALSSHDTRLPSGTVTLLFTDLQGSTRLVERLGSAFADVLAEHFAILRDAIHRHDGYEFGTEGDALFAVFTRARDALSAAAEAQRGLAGHPWPEGVSIRVRMGLHTGTPDRGPGSYVGHDVHRAARISAVAHGGQILLSDATRALATPFPADLATVDLGRHRLKDLSDPEHLFQLTGPGLVLDFPPLASTDVVPTNLPRERTSFVGRQCELDELQSMLRRSRLVTLTGPAGTGKTRLAQRLARLAMPEFPDGVWLVRLAEIDDPCLVGAAIAEAMGLADVRDRRPTVAIAEYTRGQRHLVVLDNFEHVVAAAETVTELLDTAPGVSVLVTSREVLGVRGEQAYPVAPLPLPDTARPMDADRLCDIESVRLFCERARAVRPDFAVSDDDVPALVEIARRLEGLPLAIELAAARTAVLSPQELAGRLEGRLGVLTGGPSDLPERQRTLRGAIAWSHELLTLPEKRLLERLSVFAAPVLLSTAEEVCADEDAESVLDTLTSLVNKSLVRRRPTADGRSRFGMLESVKEYVREVAEDLSRCRDAHARHYERLAEEVAGCLFGPRQQECLDHVEDEAADIAAAIGWCIEQGDPDRAGRIAVGVHGYWWLRGQITTGRHLVRRVLSAGPTDPLLRAWLMLVRARLGLQQGAFAPAGADFDTVERVARGHGDDTLLAAVLSEQVALEVRRHWVLDRARVDEAAAAFQRAGDEVGEGELRLRVGAVLAVRNQHDEATAELQRALELMRRAGNSWGEASTLNNLGFTAAAQERFVEAEEFLTRGLGIFERLRTPEGIGEAAETLAAVRIGQGRVFEAIVLLERSLAIFRELTFHPGIATALTQLAWCRAHRGDLGGAAGDALQAVELSRSLGLDLQLAAIEGAAAVLGASGRPCDARSLLDLVAAVREEHDYPLTPLEAHRIEAERASLAASAASGHRPCESGDAPPDTVEGALAFATRELRRAQPAW